MNPFVSFVCSLPFLIQTSISQPASRLFAARPDEVSRLVYSFNLDGSGMAAMTMPLSPKCVAIDWTSSPHKMYVGLVPSSGNGKIIRCNTDGTNPEDVVTNATSINDIELDLDHRRVYWLQNTYADDRIFYAAMDGVDSSITQIYATTVAMRDLWGLALDVCNQRLWITERGSTCYNSYIRRMSLSGSGVTVLVNPVCNPHDIEYFSGTIYWGDADGLERANPDGTGIDTVTGNPYADGMAIDGTNGRIYWANYSLDKIERVDIDGRNRTDIVTGLGQFDRVETDYNPSAVPVAFRDDVPAAFALLQNYPNPFNPTTTIEYSLPSQGPNFAEGRVGEGSRVVLKLYDVLGREVTTLVNETKQPGTYTVQWDAGGMASGVYFYRLMAGSFIDTKKLVLLR